MLELNRIYNLKCEDGIPQLADNSIDLVVTSPPYNVGWGGYIDNRPYEEYINWLEGIFSLLYPKLCPGGRRCVNIGQGKNGRLPTTAHITQRLEKIGYLPFAKVIWDKQQTSRRTAFKKLEILT